jgi:hypothetical protein
MEASQPTVPATNHNSIHETFDGRLAVAIWGESLGSLPFFFSEARTNERMESLGRIGSYKYQYFESLTGMIFHPVFFPR